MAKILKFPSKNPTNQNTSLLQKLRKKLSKREEHKFDYDSPIYGHTEMYIKNKEGKLEEYMCEGYQCLKCGEVLWLGDPMIRDLPASMRYCKGTENG